MDAELRTLSEVAVTVPVLTLVLLVGAPLAAPDFIYCALTNPVCPLLSRTLCQPLAVDMICTLVFCFMVVTTFAVVEGELRTFSEVAVTTPVSAALDAGGAAGAEGVETVAILI